MSYIRVRNSSDHLPITISVSSPEPQTFSFEKVDIPPLEEAEVAVDSNQGTTRLLIWEEGKMVWCGIVPITSIPLIVDPEVPRVLFEGTKIPACPEVGPFRDEDLPPLVHAIKGVTSWWWIILVAVLTLWLILS